MRKKIKVAFITNIIAPYRVGLFNKLEGSKVVDFKVFFEREGSAFRHWSIDKSSIKFDYETLNTLILKMFKRSWISWNAIPRLSTYNPDIVVCGGYGLTFLQIFVWAYLFRKKIVLWGELTRQSESKRNFFQKLIRRCMAKIAAAAWAPSSETRRYYESIGVKKIYVNLLTIDSLCVTKVSKKKYSEARKINLLYVGRISRQKGIDKLIETYLLVRKNIKNISLTLVGEPDSDKKFVDEMMSYNGRDGITFVSFTQNLDKIYKDASVFIFFTRQDTFGLVVSEALAYGLPVICSKYAGCAEDLVKENGIVINPDDVGGSANKIRRFLADKRKLFSCGKRSIEIIKQELTDTSVRKLNEMFIHIVADKNE
ncbi:glycosyltransferase family 4 protein [Candidatus Woesearchaeota archaeon]|nr:glycosyltransferase family 4 protein [Candidatus Woesearchaeota archaeon]